MSRVFACFPQFSIFGPDRTLQNAARLTREETVKR
jgi:hypothetical protein